MARVTKAMLEEENTYLHRVIATLTTELELRKKEIAVLKDSGGSRIIQTLCCAHDKAIDALSHALGHVTSLMQKGGR